MQIMNKEKQIKDIKKIKVSMCEKWKKKPHYVYIEMLSTSEDLNADIWLKYYQYGVKILYNQSINQSIRKWNE